MTTATATAIAIAAESTQALCGRCHLPIPAELDSCRPCAAAGRKDLPSRIGPYLVLGRLGAGAGTEVYECADSEGAATLAVKVFVADDDGDRMAAERRLREARAWARLGHPGVVRLHGIGRWCGSPFVAMERAAGRSVGDQLAECGRMEPLAALKIAAEVARVLEAGSARGLVHRAVKPANILIGSDGTVKLTDPGTVGRTRDLSIPDSNEPGPDPLAPELRDGQAVDFRSDIYALGITLGQMLGAFDDQTPECNAYDPAPAIARVLLRMTAHRREDRFASHAELRAALAQAIVTADPVVIENSRSESRGWASAGALMGFVMAAAISAFLPPPSPVLPVPGMNGARGASPALAAAPGSATSPASDPAKLTPDPDGDAVEAVLRDGLDGPASYSYVMGTEEAGQSFDVASTAPERKARRLGGRLQVPPGLGMSWAHRSDVEGDLNAELDVVLSPAATAELALRTADGRELIARIRAWTVRPDLGQRAALAATSSLDADAGVLLLAGNPPAAVAGIALGVTPGRPHHLELRRKGSETRVFIDGRESLRAEIPLEGSFRVGIATPAGGAEIRSFAYAADREIVPPPAS